MNVVKASKENLKELAGLQKKYMQYHAELDEYFVLKENISRLWIKYMKNLIEDEDNIVFMAVEDGKIIGYMTGNVVGRAPIYKIERVGRIGDAFVLPEFRRKGAFTMLLERMLSWMRAKGVNYVEHPISTKNKIGRIVWKKRGFEDFIVFTKRRL